MIYKIYDMLLSYSARKQYYKLFFFLCDNFPRLRAEHDRQMEEMAKEGERLAKLDALTKGYRR